MAGENLFEELPERAKTRANAGPLAAPRLREPKRDQIELGAMDIESLIGQDHP
ncbi:MAG TPA: IS5/IS1182 family transposase, partial [Pseudolabrys sp.]|nr:IS5/IS1182 family transposase [Pseudolabrys sp.]